MLKANWDRLNVMVVEDNSFMRQLFSTTLKAFGIENVVVESDGAAAVERLKLSTVNPIKAQLGTIDVIFSDYVMPLVDGNLFLRWVRSGKQVPDRFVPFVMVSGAADREVVAMARDSGVTEFLAKPFSAKSVADVVLRVVNAPRQFVLSRDYFGPDRRRRATSVPRERRNPDDAGIQVLHRASDERTLRDDVRAVHFRFGNRLREKVGEAGGRGQPDIDPLLIQAAEQRIQSWLGDYSDWVAEYIESLTRWQGQLVRNEGDPRKLLANINRVAHEMRGQGGIFDYPLITAFGKSLYNATRTSDAAITRNQLDLIAAHIDAMRTVFHQKIQGDGGETGATLLREIEAAVRRHG